MVRHELVSEAAGQAMWDTPYQEASRQSYRVCSLAFILRCILVPSKGVCRKISMLRVSYMYLYVCMCVGRTGGLHDSPFVLCIPSLVS